MIICPFCKGTNIKRLETEEHDDAVIHLYLCDPCKRYFYAIFGFLQYEDIAGAIVSMVHESG